MHTQLYCKTPVCMVFKLQTKTPLLFCPAQFFKVLTHDLLGFSYHFIVFFILSLYLLFSLSVMSNSVIPWPTARQASLSFTISQSLLKLRPIKPAMPSNHPFVIPFSSCRQPFSASGSFLMSQLFTSGGQYIGASYSTLFP